MSKFYLKKKDNRQAYAIVVYGRYIDKGWNMTVDMMRINQLPVSAARWQHRLG